MCIVLLHLSHPDFLFVCGANRDEYLARPAAASHWHRFPPPDAYTTQGSPSPSLALLKSDAETQQDGHLHNGSRGGDASGVGQSGAGPSRQRPILSGLDVHPLGGGTWIGMSASGRFGALTNYTEYTRPSVPQGRGLTDLRSRGTLVKDWLLRGDMADGGHTSGTTMEKDLDGYLHSVDSHSDEWPGFNVLAGYLVDEHGQCAPRIGYVTNRSETSTGVDYLLPDLDAARAQSRSPDTNLSVGLSNSTLHTPWTKVHSGQAALDEALRRYDERKAAHGRDAAEAELSSDIFALLATSTGTIEKREDLAGSVLITPLPIANGAWYATRVATVIFVRRPDKGSEMAPLVRSWERDVHILDATGQKPVRCGPEHQRYHTFPLSRHGTA